MNIVKSRFTLTGLWVVALVLSACSNLAPVLSTETPASTATITLTPTRTPRPTRTPFPTFTPNFAATQQIEEYQAEIQSYFDLGYIDTAEGTIKEYNNFMEEWAQLRWYQWWNRGEMKSDFVMSAHFKWSSAYRNADVSGCGFVFAIQENNDHFAVFLDRKVVRFINSDQSSGFNRRMGVTRGTGRVNFNNPADQPVEADFTLIVKDSYVYVIVDSEIVGEYTLPQNRATSGGIGLSLLSGTNKDFGTRCQMSNIYTWTPK